METPAGSVSPLPKTKAEARLVRARTLQGHRAGFVSRLVADTLDVIVVVLIEFGILLLGAVIRYLFTRNFHLFHSPTWLTVSLFGVIAVIYLTSGWSSTGKTLGKQTVGVRVVGAADGGRVRSGTALVRAVLYILFPWGLVWSLVSRHNASLQDLLLGTVVLYDWQYRQLKAKVDA
jgi:uncharacterized RDD family membrane protein YckC